MSDIIRGPKAKNKKRKKKKKKSWTIKKGEEPRSPIWSDDVTHVTGNLVQAQ